MMSSGTPSPAAAFSASETRDNLARLLFDVALLAGPVVLECYQQGCAIRIKPDASPVSEADERAEEIILAALARRLPDVPVIAEESASRLGAMACGSRFILVDPVDGTREFVERTGEFTVNLALIEDGAPVAGAIYAPTLGLGWHGGAQAMAVQVGTDGPAHQAIASRRIGVRPAPAAGLSAFASRSHGNAGTDGLLARLPVAECLRVGSSLKFCRLAEGAADVYPRIGPTMEWDTAAGDAILRAAGGIVFDLAGRPLRYGKAEAGYRNPDFIAWGDPAAGTAFAAALAASSLS